MKKINLLIICFLLGYSAFGQVPSTETFGATVPKEAIKLDRDHVLSIAHKTLRQSYVAPGIENTYQLDGLVISYWGLSVSPDNTKSLEDSQKEILGLLKRNEGDIVKNSKIVTVNNIRFLVYEYHRGDDVSLRFQSELDKNHKNVNGLIQFKKPDEDKAHKALDDSLHTIHFKD